MLSPQTREQTPVQPLTHTAGRGGMESCGTTLAGTDAAIRGRDRAKEQAWDSDKMT